MAFPCSAGATHSPGLGGPDDFIVGGAKEGIRGLSEAQLTVAAHSGAAGEDPRGRVRLTVSGLIGEITAAGAVQCLMTSRRTGNGFAELEEPLSDGSRFLLFDATHPNDFFWGFSSTRPERTFGRCMTFGRGLGGEASGNFVVHDAPPLGPQF